MDGFFNFLTYFCLGALGLIAILALLLSLPNSRLRTFVFEILGWSTAAISTVSVISPIDLIPDFIPVVGWGDDVAAIVAAITGGVVAYSAHRSRIKMDQSSKNISTVAMRDK